MNQVMVAIVATRETIFFGDHDGTLRQWIMITVDSRHGTTSQGVVTIEAGGEQVQTSLQVEPGVHEYRCYAPVLWPGRAPEPKASVRLTLGSHTATATASVGYHRPWTIYLLSDVCTDYSWVYDSEAEFRAHDAALTAAELDVAERMAGEPEPNRNHYNFVHARETEFFLEHYPDRADQLFRHIQSGTITLNPIFNMCLTPCMSLEELIRQLYPARQWASDHGLDIGYANLQETPTMAWSMVTVFAGSGVNHLVKTILPYECPWAARLEEPPVYAWEGPDGSRILVRHRNSDYVEGNFVLRDLRSTNTALHDRIVPGYESLGHSPSGASAHGQGYPYDAIALLGCYGDLAPNTRDMPAKKAATIAAYNAQGWAYPRLVNASHKQFWDDLDGQIAERSIEVPVFRGDFGAAWDAWPVSLALDFAAWRRVQERAGTADKLAAVLSRLDSAWYDAHREPLAEGWRNVIYLTDHAWNGANDANRVLNAALRRRWQVAANSALDGVIADGLSALGRRVPTGDTSTIMVFNGLTWDRSGVVKLAGKYTVSKGMPADAELVDVASGQPVPSQTEQEDGRTVVSFLAREVPSVGYRTFAVRAGKPQKKAAKWRVSENRLEGPFYAVEVSPATGGIVSLYDKVRQVELVDSASPYHLNQCLYLSDGVEHTPQAAAVEIGPCGPVYGQLIVRAALKHSRVTSIITLYTELDRVDIRNEVEKQPTSERQELDFAFPFRVPDRQYRFEAPGAIITPGAEQLPGAGQAVTVVRHFVDIFNDAYGVTLSQADSAVVEFGHRTTTEDPLGPDPNNSTVLAMAFTNIIDWNEITRDQAGESRFTFRYSLRGHEGGFDPVAAVRFGWEDNNELLPALLPSGQRGDLPADMHSFVRVTEGGAAPHAGTPSGVVLSTIKPAEEEGLIVRLWEPAGHDAQVALSVSGLGHVKAACLTDHLERDGAALTLHSDGVTIPVRARGIATARLTF